MKNYIYALFASVLIAFSAQAGTTNLFNLASVTGTNAGNTFNVSGVFVPKQQFLFQSLGITNASSGSYTTNGITNVIQVNVQISVDAANSNWVTLATWAPSTTNATVENFTPTFSSISLPMRAQIVTSNACTVATFVTQ